MLKKIKKTFATLNPKQLTAGLFVIAFALAGAYLILQSHAAPYAVATEAESGTLGSNASIVNDYAASGGKAVMFGTTNTSTGTSSKGGGSKSGGGGGGSSGGSGSSSTSGGCTSGGTTAPCIGSATTGASGWGTPVFDDEFSGTSLNTTNWHNSWFNNGTMNNVSTSSSNVAVSGGNLILTLSSSSVGAMVDSDPHQASTGFQFGTGYYVEARIYFPGNGSNIYNWPAFWTDGQSWPTDGEIDIAEGLGQLTSNYHSPQGANNGPQEGGNWADGWHTYAVDRESGMNTIYWDGKIIRSYSTDDGGSPEYLLFNVGCSGGCTTGSASQVKVDYVRVWKK